MTAHLDAWAHGFLARPGRFGTLATVEPDGFPHQAVVWYLLRGDAVVVNSALGRRWPANLLRDPRASLLVEDAYEYVALRGLVEPDPDPDRGQADIAEMARAYLESTEAEALIRDRFLPQRRISFLLRPTAVAVHR